MSLLDVVVTPRFGLLLSWIINALVLMGAAYLLKGVQIQDFVRALIVAAVLAVLNMTLGAVLDFFTTPIRWITLGLFSLVVDAVVIMVADYFLKGFTVKGFGWALLLAVFMAIANSLLHA